jgi:ADP-ribose pyrophosphatase YjhB (NUDIX family)
MPPVRYNKDTHCSYCGYPHGNRHAWPRLCPNCKNLTYRNPLPVVVALVPVESGLITVRRSKPPGLGRLALPGGLVEIGETWQEAGVREVYEETGLQLDAAKINDFYVRPARDETISPQVTK